MINPLYEKRLLVFIEDIDKGIFHQVLLTPDQFKKVSDAIIVEEGDSTGLRPGFKMARYNINVDIQIPSDTFIGCESIDEEDSK